MTHFIEVYKGRGNDKCPQNTCALPIDQLESTLERTRYYGNLETIAIFKITPKTK